MLDRMFGKKLSSRLIIIMSLTMLTVYLIVGLTVTRYMLDRQVAYLQTETDLKARIISRDISSNFIVTKNVVQQMTYNREIRKYLREVGSREQIKDHPLYPDVLATLEDIAASNHLFSIAWVANDMASFYTENSGYVSDAAYIIVNRPWHKAASEAKGTVFSKPYVDYGTKRMIISCISPIREAETLVGYCAIDLVISSIPTYMEKYKIGSSGQNFILTGDGTFIYSDDPSKIMSKTVYQEKTGLEQAAHEVMTQKQGFREIVYNGAPYFLTYRTMEESDWIVGSLVKKEEALRSNFQMARRIYFMLAFSAAAILLSIYLLVSKMIKPFSAVTHHARMIAEGDFSRNLPEAYIKREDEMGELSKAVQLITHTFRSENELLEQKIKEKNQELEEQYRYISEADRISSLGILVAGVAHEINTPLGVSMTSATYLEKINKEIRGRVEQGTVTRGQFVEFIENVDTSISLLSTNISRVAELIAQFKQVAVDQNTETHVPFSLREYIDLVIASTISGAHELKLELEVRCSEELMLNSYPGVFSQILTHLMLDAIHHGFQGAETGHVLIDCQVLESILHIRFCDNGRGMSPEILKRIFDPFFSTDHQNGSSGLGMHIVYNLVTQKLKGSIRAESAVGRGTTFFIEVPVAYGEADLGRS